MWYVKYEKCNGNCHDCNYYSNDEWAPTTVVINKKCDCKKEAEIAELKEELENHFEEVLNEK
jgi:hypothetical protein